MRDHLVTVEDSTPKDGSCAVLDVLVPGFPQVCQPVVGPEPRSEQHPPKGLAPALDPPEGRATAASMKSDPLRFGVGKNQASPVGYQ